MFNEITSFRIDTARLKSWDYSDPWWYYVTINTKNHVCYFGEVVDGKMTLNDLGKIAGDEWLKTKELRSNVELDYFVVMPNHVHGIVLLNEVKTRRGESLQKQNETKFGKPIKNSLSVIINQFKGAVTRKAKEKEITFSWQARFYDRIIRNEKELYNIRKYIEQNPLKWEFEKNNPENICEF